MIQYRDWFVDNPVLRYHLLADVRARLRQPAWQKLGLAGPIAILYFWMLYMAAEHGGTEIYVAIEMAIVCLVTIPMTHALMSSEFERRTWDGLILTRLSAGQIVMGKLLSRLAYLVLLVAAFAPVLLASTTGGSNLGYYQHEYGKRLGVLLLLSQLIILSWGVVVVTATLYLSYRLRRGIAVAAASFAGQVLVLIIIPVLWMLFLSLFGHLTTDFPTETGFPWMFDLRFTVVAHNPIVALAFLLDLSSGHRYAWLLWQGWGVWHVITYALLALAFVGSLLKAVKRDTLKPR